ncbi:unnamed protein product [Meganyctiphanes norvegica]|uniref:Oplophorus-luciferin 2-monooxygenase non-catalytic subunit n=1 Tax=Meganyctiphanes norvegica TaxID=48144 RepID=A0AAV2Q407_MEGNR
MKSHSIILLYILVKCVSGQVQDGRHQSEHYGYEDPCPDAKDIAPCLCSYDSNHTNMYLYCDHIESEEQLRQIFKADFPFKNFKKFHLQDNNNIKVLEAGVFNGISFEVIDIQHNMNLEVIELEALDSCYETVTEIKLSFNKIISFPFDELSQLSKLRNFDISGNSLTMIPADAFNGLTALETLDISSNTNIVGTFQDLPNLREIRLSWNELSTVPANFIKTGSSDLSFINLYDNNISSVEPGAFDIVDGLDINMNKNSLSTLDEATWRPLLEVGGSVSANDNLLICGCDIAWLFGEDQLLEHVDKWTNCNDGEFLHDLDPSIFDPC